MRALPLKAPAAVAAQLQHEPWIAWLDSEISRAPQARYSILTARPTRKLTIDANAQSADLAPLRPSQPNSNSALPFHGGWLGYFAYDFARLTLPWTPPYPSDGLALAEWGYFPAALVWDHRENTLHLTGDTASEAASVLLSAYESAASEASSPNPRLAWQSETTHVEHIVRVQQTRGAIAAGDLYQINLARTLTAALPQNFSPFRYFLNARRGNPAPFTGFLNFPSRKIASMSPERFVTATAAGAVETRPIKGTIKSSADPGEDVMLRHALLTSEKDHAENIMIVDLLRNDLSRVCQPNTVLTPDICVLETYEGLHHLVSSVTGQLKPQHDVLDLIRATFPGGSITGAPKIAAMDLIARLENRPRGIFSGAIGYIGADGAMDLSIAIRTVEFEAQHARLHVGGGITALSDPQQEYEETDVKVNRILALEQRDG